MDLVNATLSNHSFENATECSRGAEISTAAIQDTCANFTFYLNTVLIGVLCLLGLAGNTLSIVVLRRDRHNEVATFLLQVLAAADNALLAVSFVVLAVFVGLVPLPGVRDIIVPAVPYLKKYLNPLGYMTKCMTVWTTVLLAINRFVAVCKPFAFNELLTVRVARVQVFVVLTFSIALNVPRFFQYDVVVLKNACNETVIASVLTPLGKDRLVEFVYFNVIYTTVILGLPVVLLVCFNALLIRRLRASMHNMRRNSISYIGSQERNITIVMVIIIVEFLVCHTPDRIINILKYASDTLSGSWSCPHPLFFAASISNLLIVINSSTNFIVYYVFRERFRRILREQVCAGVGCCDRWDSCCCCYCCRSRSLDGDGLSDGGLGHRSESSEMVLIRPKSNGIDRRNIDHGDDEIK